MSNLWPAADLFSLNPWIPHSGGHAFTHVDTRTSTPYSCHPLNSHPSGSRKHIIMVDLRGWPRKEPHSPLKQTLAIWVGMSKDLEARSMAQEGRCRFWVDMCPWPDRGSACLDVDQGKKRQVSRAWSPRRSLLSGKPLAWIFIKKQIFYYAHVLPPKTLILADSRAGLWILPWLRKVFVFSKGLPKDRKEIRQPFRQCPNSDSYALSNSHKLFLYKSKAKVKSIPQFQLVYPTGKPTVWIFSSRDMIILYSWPDHQE